MANRKSHSASSRASSFHSPSSQEAQNKKLEARRRMRGLLLESLESRRLLTAGPQLIGIQPNASDLLNSGDVRTDAPRELTFRFDESQVIDAATLAGIRLTSAGGDSSFGLASAESDFGSGGKATIRLTAGSPGLNFNVQVAQLGLPAGTSPMIARTGSTISITLNSNPASRTTALQLINALNSSPALAGQISAQVSGGVNDAELALFPADTYAPFSVVDTNDAIVVPGAALVGASPNQNEVTLRFAEQLEDDDYRIEIFGYDDPVFGVVGLRNTSGEFFSPTQPGTRGDTVDFRLDLGPQVISVVPQPVLRNADGSLNQQRDTIVVYFNGDKMLVENDSLGQPTSQSAENPEFYQLILTNDTVRNTDDVYFLPQLVEYNAGSNSATLRFAQDLEDLPGTRTGPRTFRLRIGTRESAPIAPTQSDAAATTISDFNTGGAVRFRFTSRELGETGSGIEIDVVNSGAGGAPAISANGKTISIDLRSSSVTAGQLLAALQNSPAASSLVAVQLEPGSDPSVVLNAPINYSPITVVGLGSSFDTASDLGVIGSDLVAQTSLILSSDIDPVPYDFDLLGANDDPGHRQLPATAGGSFEQHINALFGPDSVDGITTIFYNFKTIYGADSSGAELVNAITAKQQDRAREVMQIWADHLGVQFIETPGQGITVATGSFSALQGFSPNVVIENSINTGVRIDPDFEDSLLVLEAARQWGDNYGEDWFRAALTGVGMLLGLERAQDLPPGTLMRLSTGFINAGNSNALPANEPIFPGVFDVLHGRHLFRNDSNDIDLYKFEVDLGDTDRVGLLVAETFAERLTQSSSLDTLLHLYKQNQAFAESNLAAGSDLGVRFDAIAPGRLGNNLQIFVSKSDRGPGAPVLVNVFENLITVDLNAAIGSETTAQELIDAINADPAAAAIVIASLSSGDGATTVGNRNITYSPIVLQNGDIELISRNDDYFSEDSLIQLALSSGTYYLGVSSSGNDSYDPVIQDTGLGGTTQGRYDLRLTFRAQVDTSDALRDVQGGSSGGEAVVFDGDADGRPGGVYNFWFQTRPLDRVLSFNAGGSAAMDGKIVELTGANGVVRRFEFTLDASVGVGNTPVGFTTSSTAGQLAQALANAIVTRVDLGVSAIANGDQILLEGERLVKLSPGLNIIEIQGKTIFVDKSAGPNADGSLAHPFNNIAGVGVPNAFAAAQPGDIVRIVGNGGVDGDVTTVDDNFAYEIGFSLLNGTALGDGTTMEVPKGVTTMVDAGAIFKLRRARIGVGSSSLGVDRSGGALQVLGTPYLTGIGGEILKTDQGVPVAGSVYFTSWLDESLGEDTYAPRTNPAIGDWGGISYRNDVDAAAGRRNLEDEGIFLQYVNHADIRFGGGGNVVIDSVQQVVNPIHMTDVRPTITFSTISKSSDAAMSAAPNSFEETNFHEPRFQLNGAFTSDYDRVGPEIHHNRLVDNSLNGLFIRVETPAGQSVRTLTVPARFDDIDIVHIVSENIIVNGTPGGALLDTTRPLANLLSLQPMSGGQLLPGIYNYKVSFVDANGYETPASDASSSVALLPNQTAIQLLGLPLTSGEFVARRLYRSDNLGGGQYRLVAEMDALSSGFLDIGQNAGGVLSRDRSDVRGVTLTGIGGGGTLSGQYNYRIVMVDAAGRESLASNPTSNIQVGPNSRITLGDLPPIQAGFANANVYRSARGGMGPYVLVGNIGVGQNSFVDRGLSLGQELSPLTEGNLRPRLDASLVIDPGAILKFEGARIELEPGTLLLAEGVDSAPVIFTSKLDDRYGTGGSFDTNNDGSGTMAQARDWGGIYAAAGSTVSLDYATVAYAGGVTKLEGTFKAFSPIEIQQASARITNSVFEFNEDGIGGQGPTNRLGRLDTRPSTIFIRGTRPILIGNTFRNNTGSPVNIDANSLNAELMGDIGRSTGMADRVDNYDHNRGPLVRENRFDNNDLNGMEIRGDLLTVESVWDDTDIVHVLYNSITVTNVHHDGGLRLQSSSNESLVIKLLGYGSNFNSTAGTGFTATGYYTNATDRVGGTIEILGRPGFPVVLTSLHDDTVGAGLRPDGTPQTDTNNNGIATIPRPSDWRSVLLDQYSNDRSVATVLELESPTAIAPGFNSTTGTAQLLGSLAANASSSDENLRLGFVVEGVLSEPTDVDVYSFTAEAGTEVWLDVDYTTQSLDVMLELLNANGELLARSDNSSDETVDPTLITKTAAINPNLVNPLNQAEGNFKTNASGTYKEDGSINSGDAGLRVVLPGAAGARTTFYFRVRSASTNPDNFNAGLTSGSYEVQVRTRETQEFPGSTVQYADIRYATNGIHIQGLPAHSPLLGEAQEDESSANASYADNDVNAFNNENTVGGTPGARDQYIGNLLETDRATISVGGQIASPSDLDFYRFDLNYVGQSRPSTNTASVVFDLDYADGLNRADTNLSVFRVTQNFGGTVDYELVLFAEDSNIADDIRGPLTLTDIEDLTRGSVGPKDPYIGAVSLLEGTYAVAVSPSGRVPNVLSDVSVTREPLFRKLQQNLGTFGTTTDEAVSNVFDLGGYSALDVPRLYFEASAEPETTDVFVRDSMGTETQIAILNGAAGQQIVSLAPFAGQDGLRIVFRNQGGPGAFQRTISNLMVGFAERGERILNAPADPSFVGRAVAGNSIQTGDYQLEIRRASGQISDTNDRLADQITLLAPMGSQLVDGDTFILKDAGTAITFEFSTDASVVPGHVAVRYSAGDSAAQVATAIRNAVNDPGVQSRLAIKASGAGGAESGPNTDARVHLFGQASGSFGKVGVQYHSGEGDQNTNRDQGQVLIQNNFIRYSRDYGVWTEPGQRLLDPRDLMSNIEPSMTRAMSNRPATGNSSPGPVRNLRELNNSILGGFNPGIVVQNNILESGGLGGVHVAGENPIWMITPSRIPSWRDNIATQGDHSSQGNSNNPIDHFGSLLDDGDYFVIDAGRNRVQFEFEDMAGAGTGGPSFGSGTVGGNGWDDTSVPIYYREDSGSQYLRASADTTSGYSALEVMQSMRDSIMGSILVTNGTTQNVRATVSASFLPENGNPGVGPSAGYINYYNRPALFLEGVSNIVYDNNRGGGNPFIIQRVDAADTPQPFVRVINNTVYGSDGRASLDGASRASEPNDVLADATNTWQGTAHNPLSYTTNASISDKDVDLYQFKLDIGERVRIDIDTDPAFSTLDSVLQIFDASGIPQMFRDSNGQLLTIADNDIAPGETPSLDPYIDFTATQPGVYYAAVSAKGNETYDPLSTAGRLSTATAGVYTIDLQVLHPQEFTITVEDPSQYAAGSTFTIYQIPDFATGGNGRTFEFVNGGGGPVTPGNVPINIDYTNYRAADVARAIAAAITQSDLNNVQSLSNGSFGTASPLAQVTGRALGGSAGVEAGLQLFPRRPDGSSPTHSGDGIGHNRTASGGISSTSDGNGTTERFVVVSNAAWIDGNGVIQVDPDQNANNNLDQLLPETGIFVSAGASPTLMNNVFVNVQSPIIREEAREYASGLPAPFGTNIDVHPKPGEVIIGGSAYQFAEPAQANNRLGFGIEATPTNVPNTALDFNLTLPADQKVLVNAQASQFLPASNSRIIDSSLDSLEEREAFRTVKQAMGISVSPVLAPNRDATGQLRTDDPSVAPPNGQGSDVFKDRGALDRADFVGPSAEAVRPLDNDSSQIDQDNTVSVIELNDGVYPEFRLQLVDGFEMSDPFPGIGIDDSTVFGPAIGRRQPGAAVTLFENGRLLTEGFDYRLTYSTTTKELIFTPYAGVWKNGVVYEIAINNRDRFVLIAPAGDQVSDGDFFTVTDNQGGLVYFEFDSGYQLQVPHALILDVPLAGGANGGVADGDRFTITLAGKTTTFEFDRNSNYLPGNRPITFEYGDSQQTIANAILMALQSSGLAVVPRMLSEGMVFVGANAGTLLDTNFTAVSQPATTLALKIPDVGPRPGGIVDGQSFIVSDGLRTIIFEYDNDGNVQAGHSAIDFSSAVVAEDLATVTLAALQASPLNITSSLATPKVVYLGLSPNGSANAGTSGLSVIGVARTLSDGNKFSVTTSLGSKTFEFDSNASSTPGNTVIPFSMSDTESEIGQRISDAIAGAGLGLTPRHIGGGDVAIGGAVGDQVDVTLAPSLTLFGTPGVQTSTRLEVFGPLFLQVPSRGAADINEDETFSITNAGQTVVFEFDSNFSGPSVPGNVIVQYNALSTQNDIASAITAAVNSTNLGVMARNQGGGIVSLGALANNQVDVSNSTLTTSRGVVSDGEYFTISNGASSATFEFENVDRGNGFVNGRIPILFSASSTADSVVASMKAAIEAAGLGLMPTAIAGGILQLNDTPAYTTDTSTAPTLVKSGVAGGANPVYFIRDVSFTGEDMKRSIIDSIHNAPYTNLLSKDRGADTLFVENAVSISPELDSFFLRGVADLAGNKLRPNRINNETEFTILMPGVRLDYGDAPDPVSTTSGRYATQYGNDGARHVISTVALLGSTITAESDGKPTPLADGDLDDGVTFGANLNTTGVFNSHIFTSVDVTLSSPGYVDAWIDFNADGDWDDPGEQILSAVRFTNQSLSQTFQVTVPATAPVPGAATTTFARFRSSSTGGLIPTGLATDGEVEDYAVTIVPGAPPTAVADSYRVEEDNSLTTTDATGNSTPGFPIDDGVAANDIDPDGGVLAVEIIDLPQHAEIFNLNSDGTFTYRPNPNFNGVDRFTYRVNDGVLNSNNLGTVTIVVSEVNDAPIAVDDQLTIDEDQTLNIDQSVLLANDSPGPDPNEASQTLVVSSVETPSAQGGTVSLTGGRIVYTPPSGFSGTDTFVYTVTDNGTTDGVATPLSASATVTVTILDKNDPPITGDDFLVTAEDTSATVAISALMANDSPGPADESGQTLTFVRVVPTSSNGGTVVISGTDVVYTPAADFVGTDTFFYEVRDNGTSGGQPDPMTALGKVTVTVTPLNDGPRVQNPMGEVIVDEDSPDQIIDLSSVFVDPDVNTNGDSLTYSVVSNSNSGLVTASVNGDQLRLHLQADQNGQSLIVVKATDAVGASTTDTLTLTVRPVNDAPRLVTPIPDVTVDEGDPSPQIVLTPQYFYDPDVTLNSDSLTFRVASNSNALLVTPVISGNTLILNLAANRSGVSTITVTATDQAGLTVSDTFNLIVNEVDNLPVTVADSYVVPQGSTLITTDPFGSNNTKADDGVLANDKDPEGKTLSAILVSNPQHASSFTFKSNGTFTYQHDFKAGRVTDTFTYRASDGVNQSVITTVTISIGAPPPPSHQNPVMPLDVSADGFVSPIDALLVVNFLNTNGGDGYVGNLPAPPPYQDVNGDNFITPLDALLVINALNASSGGGEGEAAMAPGDQLFGFSQLVGQSTVNRHIGMRQIDLQDESQVYGPVADVRSAIIAELDDSADPTDAVLDWLAQSPRQVGDDFDAALGSLLGEDDPLGDSGN